MPWELHVVRSAEKELDKIPLRDRQRIIAALEAMREDPFSGDIAHLKSQPTAWRRRVGNWRILFDLYVERRLVVVAAIRRRSTTTY